MTNSNIDPKEEFLVPLLALFQKAGCDVVLHNGGEVIAVKKANDDRYHLRMAVQNGKVIGSLGFPLSEKEFETVKEEQGSH